MGPITLFDKSFLQSLSVDESVWFDHHFLTNICPIFYVETLADLAKEDKLDRTAEDQVRIIASKFPELHGTPNAHHNMLAANNLLGMVVPMTGQICLPPGGRPVKSGDRSGLVYDHSPEEEAFNRWNEGQFLEVEKSIAKSWRTELQNIDLRTVAGFLNSAGINGQTCKSLDKARDIAAAMVSNPEKPVEMLRLALLFLGIPESRHDQFLSRWAAKGGLPLTLYAPYAAHVLTVELFFQIAIAASLISSDRPSNRMDIGYLFYLPFSMQFVSSDKLHRKCTPLFLRDNQGFVWGPDLKEDFQALNGYYSGLPQEVKDLGVMRFAANPPINGDFLTCRIWDKHIPGWRDRQSEQISSEPTQNPGLVKEMLEFVEAPTVQSKDLDIDPSDPQAIARKRMVRLKKGSWHQLPKGFKPKDA